MKILTCQHLHIQRAHRTVLRVDRLALDEGETLAVIGPNGAGKSSLLLALAGLLPYRAGEVRFRQRLVNSKDDLAYRRQIALVLQSPLLLDTSVKENISTGLRFRHLARDEIDRRVDEWLGNLGIAHLGDRPARRLSGGEAQRVSLARAFALYPQILLLDEPFDALDMPTRSRLQSDLQALLHQTHTTTVFVTHDPDEALLLADRVAVLLDGRLRQVGTSQAVFTTPSDPGVAHFVGVENIIAGTVAYAEAGWVEVTTAAGPRLRAMGNWPVGQNVYCCLRPEDLGLDTEAQPHATENRLHGVIRSLVPQGPLVRVVVDCGFPLVVLLMRSEVQQKRLQEQSCVVARFEAHKLHLIVR